CGWIRAGCDRPGFGLAEGLLGPSIQELRPRLGCVRAAVQLEIQLAGPGREAVGFGRGRVEEVRRAAQPDAEVVRRLDHLRLRTAPSVAPTKQVQGTVRAGAVLEVADAPLDLFGAEAAVVCVGGREMGEDPRPVDAFPDESVVLRFVGVVPGEL